ncbi:MAG: hypothetical protein RJB38_551 [Pseudomonadota bacterium]|jgi:hypothetical protein
MDGGGNIRSLRAGGEQVEDVDHQGRSSEQKDFASFK